MTLPKDWQDCYFALYFTNEDGTATSTLVKPIIRATKKDGSELDFYGIRASKFGTKVPSGSESWGIFRYTDGEFELLVSGDIPEPNNRQLQELSDGRLIYVRRSQANLMFSISMLPKTFKSVKI